MRKRRVILWEGLPESIYPVAKKRTEGILNQCCKGNYYPKEIDRLFGFFSKSFT